MGCMQKRWIRTVPARGRRPSDSARHAHGIMNELGTAVTAKMKAENVGKTGSAKLLLVGL